MLLGRSMGFTLSLAGIAGFIVAIGITADSFVVFFERLKDEVKEGRTVRSAVPRAWVRARRTILSADAVSLLAAVVLYLLASGQVAGFAFTLGLSTIIDLVIVFLFTHPLVSVLSGSKHVHLAEVLRPRWRSRGARRLTAGTSRRRSRRRHAYEGVLTMGSGFTGSGLLGRLYRGDTKFDFIGSRKKWYIASAVIMLICLFSMVFRGFNWGIEFKGGEQYRLPIKPGTSLSQIRDAVASAGRPGRVGADRR